MSRHYLPPDNCQKRFIKEIDTLFKQHNITKGKLHWDIQTCNINIVNIILGQMSQKFNVSKEVVKYRMLETGFLEISEKYPKRVREYFHN
jgi:hypothetical protein